MTDQATPRTWMGTPRWAKWLLILSLASNFVVIGLAVGAALKSQKHGHGHGGAAAIGQIMWALPNDKRDAARELLRAARPDFKALRAERKAAKLAVADAIERTPFDAEGVREAFTALRAKDQSAKVSTHEVMVEILKVLSAEERADVADSLRKHGR